jgi:hypothetical protein
LSAAGHSGIAGGELQKRLEDRSELIISGSKRRRTTTDGCKMKSDIYIIKKNINSNVFFFSAVGHFG